MRTKSTVRLLLGFGVATAAGWGGSASARADLWTNAAGHAIEAKLVGGDSRTVILERPNGGLVKVSPASLSAGSREAVARQLASKAPGTRKEATAGGGGGVAAHARALYEAGQINAEQLEATLGSLKPAVK